MPTWLILLLIVGAMLYLIVPVDLIPDFIPVLGRLDDLLFLFLAMYLYWKRKRRIGEVPGGGAQGARDRTSPGWRGTGVTDNDGTEGDDPYTVLDVDRRNDEASIKRAYREMLRKYHPDRVQHLGEEFQKIAARKTIAINRAYERIKREKRFT